MASLNPEAASFNPILIAEPTAFDIAFMRAKGRPRAASDPGPLPQDELNGSDLPIDFEEMPPLSPTSFCMDFETREPNWSPGHILNPFQEDGQFFTDPLSTPMIYPEPEQMHSECDPMFYYPDPFCLPLPVLSMDPISEVPHESHPICSNPMFGYDPNTPFLVPGPTHFIMEHVFNRMFLDDTTYPGFTVLANDAEQEQDEDDEYVIFGLNDPSEHTDFGRAMAAKHSVPQLEHVSNFGMGPAPNFNEPLDRQPQLYCSDGTPFVHEGPDVLLEYGTPFDYFDPEVPEPAMMSTLNPEAPDFTPPMVSKFNPEAPDFDMDVNVITLPSMKTPSPRLRLAMQPLLIRAKRLNINEEDLNLGRISWVDRSSWFPESDTK